MRRSYWPSLPNWKSQQQPTAYWTIIYGIRWSGPENNRILPILNTHPPKRSIAQQYHLLHCHQKQEIANSKKDCNTTTTEQHETATTSSKEQVSLKKFKNNTQTKATLHYFLKWQETEKLPQPLQRKPIPPFLRNHP